LIVLGHLSGKMFLDAITDKKVLVYFMEKRPLSNQRSLKK
jgi:hypothetical protein